MNRPPRFTDTALASALGHGRAPGILDRAGRIKLLGEFAAVLDGREPSRDSLMFLAGAIRGWLTNGGSLERDYLNVIVNGSHHTPARVWNALQALPLKGTTDAEGADTLAPSSSKNERRK